LGWDEKERPRRCKGDPQKVKLARRLCRETTLSLERIAQRLATGSWTCVSNLLNEKSRRRCVNREDTCPKAAFFCYLNCRRRGSPVKTPDAKPNLIRSKLPLL
jgi:hypothetical protein